MKRKSEHVIGPSAKSAARCFRFVDVVHQHLGPQCTQDTSDEISHGSPPRASSAAAQLVPQSLPLALILLLQVLRHRRHLRHHPLPPASPNEHISSLLSAQADVQPPSQRLGLPPETLASRPRLFRLSCHHFHISTRCCIVLGIQLQRIQPLGLTSLLQVNVVQVALAVNRKLTFGSISSPDTEICSAEFLRQP